MSFGYLDILDELLVDGLADISGAFRVCQAEFVSARQLPAGGFRGRQGGADLYYADFALRILALCAPRHIGVERACEYLLRLSPTPTDIVTTFNLLHLCRLLRQCGHPIDLPAAPYIECLEGHRAMGGGFARQRGGPPSAYATFLTALCFEMLDIPFPAHDAALAALRPLQCADGGFSDQPGGPLGQTNATAAALAFLLMRDALTSAIAEPALLFLQQMQCADGGLRAHPAAPMSDLLSTFTGTMTLSGLDALPRLDLAALARFVRQLACGTGGFRAGLLDEEPDIEYTYYGIGTLALLRAHIRHTV